MARGEWPYVMMMYHTVVREELHDMIAWYIGLITDFQVSAGKMGKYFKNHLPPEMYKQYLETYSAAETADHVEGVGSACDLFSTLPGGRGKASATAIMGRMRKYEMLPAERTQPRLCGRGMQGVIESLFPISSGEGE